MPKNIFLLLICFIGSCEAMDKPHNKRLLEENAADAPETIINEDVAAHGDPADEAQKRAKIGDENEPQAARDGVIATQEKAQIDVQQLNVQLQAAVQSGNKELCEQLLKNGADASIGLCNALERISEEQKTSEELVDLFLVHGAVPYQAGLDAGLGCAVVQDVHGLCAKLLDLGADPENGLAAAAMTYTQKKNVKKLNYYANLFFEKGVK